MGASGLSQYRRRLPVAPRHKHIAAMSRAVEGISAAQTAGNPRSLPFVRPGAAEHWRR
ncbi:hypothetical protein O5541_06670 [Escherichia coli]|nr:hypothetical protein [Escherichia coli]